MAHILNPKARHLLAAFEAGAPVTLFDYDDREYVGTLVGGCDRYVEIQTATGVVSLLISEVSDLIL